MKAHITLESWRNRGLPIKWGSIAACFAAVILLCAACNPGQASADPPPLLKPVNVTDDIAVVAMRTVENINRFDGRVAAYEEELLFGESKLLVSKVLCVPGGAVSAGDALVRLDVEELQEDLEQLEREIAALEEDYALINAANALDLKAVEAVEAEVIKAYEALEKTDRNQTRFQTETAELANEKELLRLRNQQAEAQQSLTLTEKRSTAEKLRTEVSGAVITAPFDGIVVRVEAVPGTMAKPFEPAVIVADYSRVFVALTTHDSYHDIPGTPVTGRIGEMTYALEYEPLSATESLSYVLEGYRQPYSFRFAEGEETLPSPGVYVNVCQTQFGAEAVPCIPINALYSSSEGSYVYKMEDNGQGGLIRVLTYIKTGRRNDSYVEVRSGLEEGDEVFVS